MVFPALLSSRDMFTVYGGGRSLKKGRSGKINVYQGLVGFGFVESKIISCIKFAEALTTDKGGSRIMCTKYFMVWGVPTNHIL